MTIKSIDRGVSFKIKVMYSGVYVCGSVKGKYIYIYPLFEYFYKSDPPI